MFLVFHQSQTWRTEHNAHLEPNTPLTQAQPLTHKPKPNLKQQKLH